MARLESVASATYVLGWISLVAAAIYRLIISTAAGEAIFSATRLVPRSLLGLSLVFFIVSIASDLRVRAGKA